MTQSTFFFSFLALSSVLGFGIARMGHHLYMSKHKYGGSELKIGKLELGRGAPGNLFVLLGAMVICFALSRIPPELVESMDDGGGDNDVSVEVEALEVSLDEGAELFLDHTYAYTAANVADVVEMVEVVDAVERVSGQDSSKRARGRARPPTRNTTASSSAKHPELASPTASSSSVAPASMASIPVSPTHTVSWCDGRAPGVTQRDKLGRCELKRGLVDVFKPMVSSCVDARDDAAGEITARFSIRGASGRVASESVHVFGAHDPAVRACVEDALGQLRFPTFTAPSQGVEFTARL